jgi:hypothetical protein
VENPQTGSVSIASELCHHYGGSEVLYKHATYPEFQKIATPDEQSYFVFSTVRHPLDKLVSRYFKYKTDHGGVFSDPASVEALKADYSDLKKYQVVQQSHFGFEDYFGKYCTRCYGDMIDMSSRRLDFVLRFERLDQDFAQVLSLLGIKQVRPLPKTNKTKGRNEDWRSYYKPTMVDQAKTVCSPFMKKWGYEFPSGWGEVRPSWFAQAQYRALNAARRVYWAHFRYSNRAFAKAVRFLRARL